MDLKNEEVVKCINELDIPQETRTQCEALLRERCYDELYASLRRVRRELLDEVHQCQQRLDNLDYLIYDIKKKVRFKREC